MNPADNLELAKVLHTLPKKAPEEAAIRGACGRAYYAAFGVARDVLMAARFQFDGGDGDHRRVIDLLKASTDVDLAGTAMLLDQLRTTRNSADYDVGRVPVRGVPFSKDRSNKAILYGHQVIADVQRVAQTDPRLFIPPTVA